MFSHTSFISTNSSAIPCRGELRYNTMNDSTQVWDGNAWVDLTYHSISREQYEEEKLCEQHPGLAQLKEELKEAQNKYDAYLALVKIQR